MGWWCGWLEYWLVMGLLGGLDIGWWWGCLVAWIIVGVGGMRGVWRLDGRWGWVVVVGVG